MQSPVILIIEDEASLRGLMRLVLQSVGLVLEAQSGKEGLGIMADPERRVQVVILDLNLPDISGAEMLRELDERHPGTAVLIVSGEEEATAPLGLPFLAKPFSTQQLVTEVRRLLPAYQEVVG